METDEFATRKDAAIRQLMRDGVARHLELLIEQVTQKIEPNQTFTRDELIELLQGVADGMRGTTDGR